MTRIPGRRGVHQSSTNGAEAPIPYGLYAALKRRSSTVVQASVREFGVGLAPAGSGFVTSFGMTKSWSERQGVSFEGDQRWSTRLTWRLFVL
jgi:hypothetical protein